MVWKAVASTRISRLEADSNLLGSIEHRNESIFNGTVGKAFRCCVVCSLLELNGDFRMISIAFLSPDFSI